MWRRHSWPAAGVPPDLPPHCLPLQQPNTRVMPPPMQGGSELRKLFHAVPAMAAPSLARPVAACAAPPHCIARHCICPPSGCLSPPPQRHPLAARPPCAVAADTLPRGVTLPGTGSIRATVYASAGVCARGARRERGALVNAQANAASSKEGRGAVVCGAMLQVMAMQLCGKCMCRRSSSRCCHRSSQHRVSTAQGQGAARGTGRWSV